MHETTQYPERASPLGYAIRLILGVGICTACWLLMNQWELSEERKHTQIAAEHVSEMLQRDLDLRVRAVQRFTTRWAYSGGMAEEAFYLEAGGILEDYPGNLALSRADSDFIVRIAAPEALWRALGRDLSAVDDNLAGALSSARETRTTKMTDPITLLDGKEGGFLIVSPIFLEEEFQGTFNLVFVIDEWVESVLAADWVRSSAGAYSFQMLIGSETYYEGSDFGSAWQRAQAASDPRAIMGKSFQVVARSLPAAASGWATGPSELITATLALLLLILGLLERTARSASAAQSRQAVANAQLNDANRQLSEENVVRRKAEKEALQASELKSRFLANMSHEIRTPVNAIMGMFELIQMSKVPDRQRRQAEVGRDAAQRLFIQLNNMLELSQIEAGTLRIVPTVVTTLSLAEQWSISLEAMIRKADRPLRASVQMGEDVPPEFLVDPGRLDQVVTNLLDNAVKYTPSGGVTLILRMAEQSDTAAPGSLILEVVDTGSGIPEADKRSIFERYQRTESGRRQFEGGMGLGLNIVLELVELMGMKLDLVDTPGGGATFRITVAQSDMVARVEAHPRNPPQLRAGAA